MRVRIALLSAVFSIALLVSALPAPASAQAGDEPEFLVDSKMLISGFGPLQGSGEAKLTYSGDSAAALRLKVFQWFDSNGDQWLNVNETRSFLVEVSDALVGRSYWGITIESATNFTVKSDDYVRSHTSGLVTSQWNSTDPLILKVNFEGSGRAADMVIETAQGVYDAFAMAVGLATGYTFNGTMAIEHRSTTLALGGYTTPELVDGEMSGLRVVLGEIIWYSYTGHVGPGSSAEDTIAYRGISIVENIQVAFAVLFVGLLMILRMPGKHFDKYEKLHPRKYRRSAKSLMSVRISAWVIAVVLVLLYLLPFAFSFASPNALMYGAYLYLVVPVAVIAEYFFSKKMYDRAALSIPEESVVEVKQAVVEPAEGEGEMICKACYRAIDVGLELFQCNCGASMHVGCAEKVQNCPACGEMLFPQRTRSIQCKSCGETFLYAGAEDSYAIQCTKCGAFQEEIKAGKNYMLVDEDPRNAFMMIRAMARSGRPAMALTVQFPGKIRSEYDLGDLQIKWFSDSTTDIDNVNPKDLEGDSMELVSTFLMTTKEAGVLVDGLDMLIEMNGFDKALAFVKRLNDLAAIHGSTIILALDKNAVAPEQFKAISDEFDEIHDYQ